MRGLADAAAPFYVEPLDEHGRYAGVFVNRLEDKLGTRMVPTAELTLGHTQGLRWSRARWYEGQPMPEVAAAAAG